MSRFPCLGVLSVKMETNRFEIEAKRMRPRLLSLATRYVGNTNDAEDVTQETLLKLWFMRERLEHYQSVEALALVTVKHLCLNVLRNRKETTETDPATLPLADEKTAEQQWVEQEEEEEIRTLVESLPNLQQAILKMRHIEGLEVEEIARITDSNAVAVRANLSRARRRIKEQFMKLR